MNTQYPTFETDILRCNQGIETAVNRGLVALTFSGVAVAAAVMRDEGVPLHVAARILGKQGKRRGSDWRPGGSLGSKGDK